MGIPFFKACSNLLQNLSSVVIIDFEDKNKTNGVGRFEQSTRGARGDST